MRGKLVVQQKSFISLPRMREAELMDDPGLDPIIHYGALRGLEHLNQFSLSANKIWQKLREFYFHNRMQTIRVLDLATGGGDIPIVLSKFANHYNLPFEFTGADISATAINFARKRAKEEKTSVSFIELDVLNAEIPQGFDVVMTSLFIHHLDPSQVIDLLVKMRNSTKQFVLVNDLIRSPFSLAIVWLAARLLSNSMIVHHDGPASVKAAYTLQEMAEMARSAGMNKYKICRIFPCRQLLIWEKTK